MSAAALNPDDGTLAQLVSQAPPLSAATREKLARILRSTPARPQGPKR